MSKKYEKFIELLGNNNLKIDEPLSAHTYFKIGGPVDLFLEISSSKELIRVIDLAINSKIPYTVIGSGSNILVTDKGYRGLIIKNKTDKISLKGFSGKLGAGKTQVNKVIVQAESGVPTNLLIRYTLNEGLKGLESFLGLPGTVGAAIYNNSHSLGLLIGSVVKEVEVIDHQGKLKKLTNQDMKFAYDYSILQKTKDVVISVTFKLAKANKDKLWESANAAIKHRTNTQPLGLPSSGCVFKNIPLADAMRIGTPNTTCSSGYLIDKSGLKGCSIGDAQVSDMHANFIINKGLASSKHVMQLIRHIKKTVKNKFGVDLQLEIFIIGQLSK